MRTQLLLIPVFAIAAASCGGSSSMQSVCATESRAEHYMPGMMKTLDDGTMVMIMSAMPAPPAMGDNNWMIQLMAANGDMIDGATLAMKQYMPDDGHVSPKTAMITPMGDGNYQVTPVNMFMAGYWEVTVDVTKPMETTKKSVMFPLCVE